MAVPDRPSPTPLSSSQPRFEQSSGLLENILASLVMGAPGSMEELYDATSAMVYSLAERLLRDPFQAEETVLDVYRYAWQSAARFNPERGSVKSWLLSITRGRSIDRLRSTAARRQKEQSLSDWDESRSAQPSHPHPSHGSPRDNGTCDAKGDPAEQLLSGERRDALEAALAELPSKQKRVIELAFLHGKTHDMIAQETNEPLGTIKSQIRRGLMRLHALLTSNQSGGHPS